MAPRSSPIVIPTDFSQASTQALRVGIDLADRLAAPVHLIYVAPQSKPIFPRNPDHLKALERMDRAEEEEARAKLEKLASQSTRVTTTQVCRGEPYKEILAYAEREDAQFIVVGTTGHSLAASVLLGSTTERVLRFTKTPVVVVPAGEEAAS